tara:strand:- start:1461 stop:1616 length:156 start_codon:yes stop_codon:yes gene_type:complete
MLKKLTNQKNTVAAKTCPLGKAGEIFSGDASGRMMSTNSASEHNRRLGFAS